MTITLRPYQRAAVDGLYMYWQTDKGSHPLIVAPTGAGKTAIIGQIVSDAIAYNSRVVILAHVKELIEQGARTLQAMVPGINIGIYSASLRSKDLSQPITYGQIQSIHKRVDDMPAPDLVIIDEAHLVPRKASTRYGAFLSAILARNPECKIVGLTATPFRLDSSWLHKGDDRLFDGIAYDIKIGDLMRDGWLAPIISKAVSKSIDMSGVRVRRGEYREDDLAKAASDPGLVSAAAKEIAELGANRKSWLVFGCGIDHAELVADALLTHGIDAEVLTGKHSMEERADMIARFKSGELRCLVNVNVLTTGFDAPNVDLLAILRATKSPSLYVQMIGRGTRMCEGKTDCLILDYGSNVMRHGLIDEVDPSPKRTRDSDAIQDEEETDENGEILKVRVCKSCGTHNSMAHEICYMCGTQLKKKIPPRHEAEAYSGALIKDQKEEAKPKTEFVHNVKYSIHRKPGKIPSLCVTYDIAIRTVREWLCPEHGGYATRKFMERMYQMKRYNIPETVEDALEDTKHWPYPRKIKVKQDGKWLKVVEVSFD